jgi:beta-glucosidase-like glycosyl hydrolase
VLLKNAAKTLPLSAKAGVVAVIGPNSNLSSSIAGYYGGRQPCPAQYGAGQFANIVDGAYTH